VHDFDPGIHPYPSGLFWTVPLSREGVEDVELDDGEASMSGDLDVRDFFNIPNALFHLQTPLSVPATISFQIGWSGPVTDRSHVHDSTIGFSGEFILNRATIRFSASHPDGWHFKTHESNTTSFFAQLGRMRNGVFFDDNERGEH
jgi:hypothetical protein